MANMGALVERYGPAPRAYLVVPMVGAFFIDFTNALLITACVNLFRESTLETNMDASRHECAVNPGPLPRAARS
jgi:hypothetical protein